MGAPRPGFTQLPQRPGEDFHFRFPRESLADTRDHGVVRGARDASERVGQCESVADGQGEAPLCSEAKRGAGQHHAEFRTWGKRGTAELLVVAPTASVLDERVEADLVEQDIDVHCRFPGQVIGEARESLQRLAVSHRHLNKCITDQRAAGKSNVRDRQSWLGLLAGFPTAVTNGNVGAEWLRGFGTRFRHPLRGLPARLGVPIPVRGRTAALGRRAARR